MKEIQRILDQVLPLLASPEIKHNIEAINILKKIDEPLLYNELLKGIVISERGRLTNNKFFKCSTCNGKGELFYDEGVVNAHWYDCNKCDANGLKIDLLYRVCSPP